MQHDDGAMLRRMSNRSMIARAGSCLASLALACTPTGNHHSIEDEVQALVQLSEESNAALMRGDIERYRALVQHADDFTLMSPFGGKPTRGVDEKRMQAMRRFFKGSELKQELVHAFGSADMVVLAIIERARVAVGNLPAQEWALRVTLVYRRDGSQWRLAHRHADPLAHGISLEHAAALGRGDAGGNASM